MSDFYSFFLEERNGEYSYHFNTREGVSYFAYFVLGDYDSYLKNSDYLRRNGYAFGFYPQIEEESVPRGFDAKLGETIRQIIAHFFRERGGDAVLLYHCDHTDERQRKRSLCFARWFGFASEAEGFVKEEAEVETGRENEAGQLNYFGYICKRENPELKNIQWEFESLAVRLGLEK